MLALINLIIRRTRLAFRTPARLALFPLLSQSGCFILQLPTGFYSHCCGSGSEPSRREQRERGWIRPRPPDGRAVLCRPGGKQKAGGGQAGPGRVVGWGRGCGLGGRGLGVSFPTAGCQRELGREGSEPHSSTLQEPLEAGWGVSPTPKSSQGARSHCRA